MTKNILGMVTFGNLNFTKISVKSIEDTISYECDLIFVVGKPNDYDTIDWLNSKGYNYIVHDYNKGFPASINDIYDYVWVENDYDALIIMGNDVVAYPNAIDLLIDEANKSDIEWICSRQIDVKMLTSMYPETRKFFSGATFNFSLFGETPWSVFDGYNAPKKITYNVISDVHNLCLYKKSVFEKIGYVDVNFYPMYYEDNDYARRGMNAGVKSCQISNSVYFHFWSRTIHQGFGSSDNKYFNNNREFYMTKWGGDFGRELWTIPFNGKPYNLTEDIILPGSLKIDSRDNEKEIVEYWRRLHDLS